MVDMKSISISPKEPRSLSHKALRRLDAFHRLGFPFIVAAVLLVGAAGSLIGSIAGGSLSISKTPLYASIIFFVLSAGMTYLTIRARRRRSQIYRNGVLVTGLVSRHVTRVVPWRSRSEHAAVVEIERPEGKALEALVYAEESVLEERLPVGSEVTCVIDPVRGKAFGLFYAKGEIDFSDAHKENEAGEASGGSSDEGAE